MRWNLKAARRRGSASCLLLANFVLHMRKDWCLPVSIQHYDITVRFNYHDFIKQMKNVATRWRVTSTLTFWPWTSHRRSRWMFNSSDILLRFTTRARQMRLVSKSRPDFALFEFRGGWAKCLSEFYHFGLSTYRTRDEIANVNFLCDDVVHALKYNRLLHKFRHRSFSATQVYQIRWNNAM